MSLKYQLRQTGVEVQAAIDKIIALEPGALDAIGIYVYDSNYWDEHSGFVPELGALLIYSDQGKFKLGNGEGSVAELPFLDAALEAAVLNHINNDVRHITAAERQTWNNKSDFSGRYQDLIGRPYIPERLRDLQDDATHRVVTDTEKTEWSAKVNQSQIADFITRTVNDLMYYYTKSETYTKEEVQQLISTIQGFSYEVVSVLPTASADTMGKIYLVPSADPQQQNVKDEYITIESSGSYDWEQIGSTSIDLSGYVTTTQLNTALAAYTTTTDLTALLAGKQDKIDSSHKLPYSLISGTPTIPDELADLADDSTHRLVTDTEKNTWNGKYTKPQTGIPATDLASGVIPDVSNFITKSVNDLTNYYLKTETYTQTEVNNLIGAIQQFHYEIVATLPASGASNILYLLGPTGSGSDKYEEYVYANNAWVKIGDTSIDLSGYVTTTALNTALADYVTSTALATALAAKQDVIDANNKLDYSLISNTPTETELTTQIINTLWDGA